MANLLLNLSEELAATVAKASPAVVRIEARRRLPASGIVWSADGIIVTAHHVIEQDDNISIGLHDGQTLSATLVGRDPSTDLAVLRVQVNGLLVPAWADVEQLRVGHLVLALGRPGRSVRAALGIISAVGESWRTPAGGRIDRYLQNDVVMYPGFSGGPLVDSEGRIVGVNTTALLRGVSLTIPVDTIRRSVEALLTHGRIQRGYLGVGAQPARLPASLAQQLGQETGLLVVSVEAGSPAEHAGLLLGDVIVAVGGQTVRGVDDLLGHLSDLAVGSASSVRFVRGGQLQEFRVTIGERK